MHSAFYHRQDSPKGLRNKKKEKEKEGKEKREGKKKEVYLWSLKFSKLGI